MREASTNIVKKKLTSDLLEHSQGAYRSRYFLVKKKSVKWRFINDLKLLDDVTIRDSDMPPSVDEFSEDFAGYPITSTIDYYSEHGQISLNKRSRDVTTCLIDVRFVRIHDYLKDGLTSV